MGFSKKLNFKKIEKIMLINPPNTMPKDSVRRLPTPNGLLCLASVLKDKYDVKILDTLCEGYYNTKIEGDYLTYGLSDEEIIKRIKEYSPDIVGITSMFSANQKNVIKCCNLVKSVNKNIIVVIGGIHPSLSPEESIKNSFVDYVIIGEGEYRFLNLIEGKRDFDGIAYKKNKKIIINPMKKRIDDLDLIPARDLIDMEKYIKIGVHFAPFTRRERVESIMTTRGCPYNCVFCSTVKYWGRKFRMRSVDNVIKEVDELVNKYKIEEIQFADDNLTINRERSMELFKRLESYGLSWCTPNGMMIKTLDKELIEAMARSGAYQLTFNYESGSQRVLKEIINKEVPEKVKVKELVKICHNNGIQVHGQCMIGLIGETREEMEETLQFPYDVDFDSISFFIANPTPGSELYRQCKEKGYINEKTRHVDFKSAEINIPKDSPDYVMSQEELVKLVDDRTKKFNEYIKEKYPERWNIKFKQFLKRHGDKTDLILGRVT